MGYFLAETKISMQNLQNSWWIVRPVCLYKPNRESCSDCSSCSLGVNFATYFVIPLQTSCSIALQICLNWCNFLCVFIVCVWTSSLIALQLGVYWLWSWARSLEALMFTVLLRSWGNSFIAVTFACFFSVVPSTMQCKYTSYIHLLTWRSVVSASCCCVTRSAATVLTSFRVRSNCISDISEHLDEWDNWLASLSDAFATTPITAKLPICYSHKSAKFFSKQVFPFPGFPKQDLFQAK